MNVTKAVASIAVCAAGIFCMWMTNSETGIGWSIFGIVVIWGSEW